MSEAPSLDALASHLEAQRDGYLQMAALNREQKETGGDLAQFVATKARLLADIEPHESALSDIRADWEGFRGALDTSSGERFDALMSDLREALSALIEAENELLATLSGRQAQVGKQIANLSRAQKLPGKYGRPATEGGSQHFDETH